MFLWTWNASMRVRSMLMLVQIEWSRGIAVSASRCRYRCRAVVAITVVQFAPFPDKHFAANIYSKCWTCTACLPAWLWLQFLWEWMAWNYIFRGEVKWWIHLLKCVRQRAAPAVSMDSVGEDGDIDLYCKLDNLSGLVGALTSIKWSKQQVWNPVYTPRTWVQFSSRLSKSSFEWQLKGAEWRPALLFRAEIFVIVLLSLTVVHTNHWQ